uniref:UDP-glucuronosyltransferase n=1 Tax=Elaeophora elaphi TaxID=1147741 RepID=A0A0R3S1Z7_9BILA
MHLYMALLLMLLDCTFSYKILVFSPRLGHSHVNFMGKIADILVEAGHDVVYDRLMESLQMEQYDLGITEHINFCGYAIFRRIGLDSYITAMAINLLEVSSDFFGVNSNPSYVPAVKESSLVLVNNDELLEYPRLISRKIVFIGGIAVPEASPLIEQLMDRSECGAILVSFGTVVKSEDMNHDTKKAFEDITFIWKYENEEEEGDVHSSNIIKRKWIPQNDLLNHRNLLGFVSHCGQNSLMESISAGVPLICMPLFGDQFRNAGTAKNRNVAVVLNKENLTATSLASALRTIIYEESYRKNAQILQKMTRQKPISARERLIRNIEFVVKYGPFDNFNVVGSDLNIFQYFLVDVLSVIVPLVLIAIYISASLTLHLFFSFYSISKIFIRRFFFFLVKN